MKKVDNIIFYSLLICIVFLLGCDKSKPVDSSNHKIKRHDSEQIYHTYCFQNGTCSDTLIQQTRALKRYTGKDDKIINTFDIQPINPSDSSKKTTIEQVLNIIRYVNSHVTYKKYKTNREKIELDINNFFSAFNFSESYSSDYIGCEISIQNLNSKALKELPVSLRKTDNKESNEIKLFFGNDDNEVEITFVPKNIFINEIYPLFLNNIYYREYKLDSK